MGMAIGAARHPRFPHEPIVHAREVPVSLAEFPAERVEGDRVVPVEPDELAQRRQARTAG